jgi:xanthine dehydrogenase small subunit
VAELPVSVDENCVRFLLDGEVVHAQGVAATTTILEYLRETLGRTGTKEGCAEGDCGACTVVLGSLQRDDHVQYRAINSCIRFLATIDGHELVTVESLQAKDGALHPVQQAMVDEHASQCGFCTPGFVMSLFALYLNQAAPDKAQVVNALAGNLCRCTGYRPIIAAGCKMNSYPAPARWSRSQAQGHASADKLKQLQRRTGLHSPGFIAPRTLDELATAFAAQPDALILAGGTDVGLWVTKQLRDLPTLIYVGEVAELQHVDTREDSIVIGAAVTLTDAWQVIVAHYPTLQDLALRFASPPVCNSGTLGGNVANGSPVGDSMPALIALGARLRLRCGDQERELPLEDFYLAYQQKDLRAGEFVVSIILPITSPDRYVTSYKVSKRFDQDIAAVCAAFVFEFSDDSISSARMAFGGMAATPARARHTEAALIGKPWSLQSLEAAGAALADDFKPLSDMRASNVYRLRIAQQLLKRCYLDRSGAVMRLHDLAPVA